MPPEVITAMSERGRIAGELLSTKFDFTNHRWVRFRTAMPTIGRFLRDFERGWTGVPEPGEPTYRQMIQGDEPSAYRKSWTDARADHATDSAQALSDLSASWREDGGFGRGAPRPQPTLRISPNLGAEPAETQ